MACYSCSSTRPATWTGSTKSPTPLVHPKARAGAPPSSACPRGAAPLGWRSPSGLSVRASSARRPRALGAPSAPHPAPPAHFADAFDTIPDALDAIRAGHWVVVLDDASRENEGDLIGAADRLTPDAVAFMVRHTSGLICVGMRPEDLDRLEIPLMVSGARNQEAMTTAFTVSVDAREGTTTGISATERCRTLRALADPEAVPEDFKRPGHVFPLRARPGGVLERAGHTEAGVDLARLAGCAPAGALCELVREDGEMARAPELLQFSKRHGLKCITIEDLIAYRRQENL